MARKTTAEIEIRATDNASSTAAKVSDSMRKLGTESERTASAIDRGINKELSEFDNEVSDAVRDAERYEASLKGVTSASGPAATATDKLGNSVKRSGDGTAKAQSNLGKFTTFLKSRFVITLGDVAGAVRGAFDLIKKSSDLSGQSNSLKLQLAKQGQDFDKFIGTLDKVARGTVSTAGLIESSSKALLLGIPAEEIAELLDIARASAIATGQSVQAAFNDIAVGIGRSSPLILDNLGIVVKIDAANRKYAESIGKVVSELSPQERKQALLNDVLEIGRKRIDEFGESADKAAVALQQGSAAMEDMKIVIGKLIAGGLAPLVALLFEINREITLVRGGVAAMNLGWESFFGTLEGQEVIIKQIENLRDLESEMVRNRNAVLDYVETQLASVFGFEEENAKRLSAALAETGDKMSSLATDTEDVVEALEGKLSPATERSINLWSESGEALRDVTESSTDAGASFGELAVRMSDLGDEIDDSLPAMQQIDSTLQGVANSADQAALSFDRLAASAGRATAVEAQIEANRAAGDESGGIHFFGTRISVPGGSRIIRPPDPFGSPSTNGDRTGSAGLSPWGGSPS